jgi:hypothetical protein
MKHALSRLMVVAVILAACNSLSNPPNTPTPIAGAVIPRPPLEPGTYELPALQARATQVQAALAQPLPVLLLPGLDQVRSLAEQIAIRDPRFQEDLFSPQGEPLRNEIFGVYPARDSDLTEATMRCAVSRCYRVEMYNYAYNLTTIAFVDVDNRLLVAVNKLPDAQPDIPPHLQQLALTIATNAPEVIAALGFRPQADLAVMENTKTALNRTLCQRSRHLCVAPTFVVGERALWAIVDLTDGALVGVRWTDLGQTNGGPVTERSLQNDVVTAMYCERTTSFERDGWKLDYMLTSSDGLRVSNARYNDKPVLDSVKLVDWHVSYSINDGFGYSDAVGCPVFSQAAVVAFQGPTIEDIREGGQVAGFALRQKFWSDLWPLPCNYYYEQRFEFYTDGRFRIVAGNLGRGCGDAGMYRPVLRIALAGKNTFANWNGSGWLDWTAEQWRLQSEGYYTPEGYQYRILGGDGGYYVEPGQGQFDDGGRGDNAYVYATLHHANRDEGDSDLITIGPCCNEGYEQGPEKFITTPPESIADSEIVIWYVPQIKIDATRGREYCWADSTLVDGVYVAKTYPCYAGPMFVPITPP